MESDPMGELSARLGPVFQKHRVIRAIPFGSMARGETSRRSDVDLLVIQDTDKRFLDRYDRLLSDVARAVPDRDGDLLIYAPRELELLLDRPLVATAPREGKVLYESEQDPAPG